MSSARWTGIPVERDAGGRTREAARRWRRRIGKRVIGQTGRGEGRVDAPCAARGAGLQDPNRPLGSFLFLGPTGVGKTELTKALAEFLFDDDARDGSHRHERVHGEALGRAADRRASGLCRL